MIRISCVLYHGKNHDLKIDAIGRNPVTGYGSGLMQIDSQHFNELSRYGIEPDHLLSDACLNIYTGAYYLAQAFKKSGAFRGMQSGHTMQASKRPPRRAARRYEYAKKIHYYYTAIKASKRTSSKDQKNRHELKKPSDIRRLEFLKKIYGIYTG
uniref:Putative transglycosylase n=1 Tax=Klebsiella pneumoniae TaxID=573 RepID=A0A8B0STD4_KLEPN|nr:putative transglycosylase [Klebsiella pneumoniae]